MIRPFLFNPQGTCTLDSYINCETYRLEYRLDSPIDRNIVQMYRDDLREKMEVPAFRRVPLVRDKLQALGLIKSRKQIEEPEIKVDNMVVVYKEEGKINNHATCVVGEADFHWIIAGGNGRVYLPKGGNYRFYTYEK